MIINDDIKIHIKLTELKKKMVDGLREKYKYELIGLTEEKRYKLEGRRILRWSRKSWRE